MRLYQGQGEDERLVLRALNDANIGEYIVLDSTYVSEGEVSNHFRHVFWFPDKQIKKGDFVMLYTKKGKDRQSEPPAPMTHCFYWNVDHNVWNDAADSVTLLHVNEFDFRKFADIHVKKK